METKWDAVFFDFDGVILDSVDVKTQAFAAMFRQYGSDIEKSVVDYHLANGGVSRFKKFEYYYRRFLKKDITEETLKALGIEFNQRVIKQVLSAPFIDGALETLKELKQHGIPAFVASGTPHEEIQVIVEKRNISQYFKEVHGSPSLKQDIVQDITTRYVYQLENCLFIGDAITDFEAAQTCGTHFIGVVKEGERSPFPQSTQVVSTCTVELSGLDFRFDYY